MAELTGDPSWRASEMQRYFDRVTRWLSVESPDPKVVALDFRLQRIIAAAALAFVNGENPSSFIQELLADVDALVGLLGRNVNDENASVEGVYSFPLATRNGERNGPREYLLRTVAEGYPLTIKTGALATRVVFADESAEGGSGRARVIGVEFIEGEHLYAADPRADLRSPQPEAQRVLATKEVILSAGAFNTPQLLKLSGIGPRQELEEHGIEVEVDLPGVGTNLQDRYEVGIVGKVKEALKVLKPCTFSAEGGNDPCLESWEQGKGVYEANGSVAAILKRSSREELDPNLFIFGVPGKFTGYYPGYSEDAVADKSLFTWIILEAHTQNRAGSVTLRSSDPRETPDIDFAYFDHGDRDEGQDQHDLAEMVKAINFVREVQKTTDRLLLLESYEEQVPGPDVNTAAALGQFVKDEAWGHHACCTAPMGTGDEAVVDSRFRVRGTEGLRVVDASVFPEILGLFIVTPIYMASEKATDVILEDWGETRVESNQP